MKILRPTLVFGVVLSTISLCRVSTSVVAQETLIARPTAGNSTMREVRVKNVPPSVMAWWLDPAHSPMPSQFQHGRDAAGIFPPNMTKNDATNPLGNYRLPEGVQRIIPSDPQHHLLVDGTDAGVAELQKTIALLDRPLRQVEIEVQYVEINSKDMEQLGVFEADPGMGSGLDMGSGPWKRGVIKANIHEQIKELLKQNKVKVLMAPRVLAINKLAASLYSVTSNPDTRLVNGQSDLLGSDVPIGVGIGITAFPTINDDETMSLLLAPGRILEMREVPEGIAVGWNRMMATPSASSRRHNIDGVQILHNMRDGAMVALTGGDSRLVGRLHRKGEKPSNLVLLVTMRTVRRAGE